MQIVQRWNIFSWIDMVHIYWQPCQSLANFLPLYSKVYRQFLLSYFAKKSLHVQSCIRKTVRKHHNILFMLIFILKVEGMITILVVSALSAHKISFIRDILTSFRPSGVSGKIILVGKVGDFHSFLKKRAGLAQIYNVELENSSFEELNCKIKPLGSSFGIDIVLKDQIILEMASLKFIKKYLYGHK